MYKPFVPADRDECSEWGYCDQGCSNTDGSYSCTCVPGYAWDEGNKTCRASRVKHAPPFVYFTNLHKIYKVRLLPCAHFSSHTFSSNTFSSNPIRLGLDEKDWTKSFGRKSFGRKTLDKKVLDER